MVGHGQRRRSRGRLAALIAGCVLFLVIMGSPASAHTDFESSEPTDGSAVTGPVEHIVIRFSGPADPAGEGFEVRLPSGRTVTPVSAVSEDGRSWQLTLDPPVEDGAVGVRWQVQAPDAHPIQGSFSFTVNPAQPSSDPQSNTPTTAPGPAEVTPTTQPLATDAPDAQSPTGDTEGTAPATTTSPLDRSESATLEEFLADPEPGATTASIGFVARLLGIGATAMALGLAALAITVLTDSDPERFGVIRAILVAGAVAAFAGSLDLVSQVAATSGWPAIVDPATVWSFLRSSSGSAVLLRTAGGLTIAFGLWSLRSNQPAAVAAPLPRPVAVGSVGLDRTGPPMTPRPGPTPEPGYGLSIEEQRRAAAVLLPGCGLLLLAMTFDGHSTISQHRLLTSIVNIVHVTAGSVWVGGLIGVVGILAARMRAGRPLGGVRLGMRFSTVAAMAVMLTGAAGLSLTIDVADSPEVLFSTAWGRVLLAKLGLVVTAAAIGAYNHFHVLRAIPATPGSKSVSQRFRRTAAIEATILILVLAATAALVAADPT